MFASRDSSAVRNSIRFPLSRRTLDAPPRVVYRQDNVPRSARESAYRIGLVMNDREQIRLTTLANCAG
jgi:hypothetical protein